MRKLIRMSLVVGTFFMANCDPSLHYDDFVERKGNDLISFKTDDKQCQAEGKLLASQSEGSKRAGEILLDIKYYKMSCMKRKGWISKKGS